MGNKLFLDPAHKPDEKSLESVLGRVYPLYQSLLTLTGKFSRDWNFSKSGGWMLKVHGNKKALLYLIPMENEFKISMAIREKEREAFMSDPKFQSIHPLIYAAKKFVEGYALQFMITNEDDFQKFEGFLTQLISLR
jgi:hypothetical protein